MNDQTRQFMVLVIGISVVGGALWSAVIKPLADRQAEFREALDAETAEIRAGRDMLDAADETDLVTETLKENAAAYQSLWGVAADASSLYDTLREFARESGVSIDRIEPRRVVLGAAVEGVLKDYDLTAERAGYQVDVQGSFESVARFVRAVQSRTGLSRIDTIRISPGTTTGSSPDVVQATIATSHIGISGVLAAFEPGTEAAP